MGDEGSRRFTDREVALILKRATDVDEAEPSPGAAGLTLKDLTGIAREVGISEAAITRAVASLDRSRGAAPSLAGAPRVRKAVHAVPGKLDEEGVARLMRLVDDRVESTGTITEALGSVRWTGRDRFKSTRVSVTPADGEAGQGETAVGETVIEVVEKAEAKMRRVVHLLPPAWALILAAPLVEAIQPSPLGLVVILVLMTALGLGIGRGVWALLSAWSGRRVEALAEELAGEAMASLGASPVSPSGDPTSTDSRSFRSSSRSPDSPSPDR